jgi:hypothetical protein
VVNRARACEGGARASISEWLRAAPDDGDAAARRGECDTAEALALAPGAGRSQLEVTEHGAKDDVRLQLREGGAQAPTHAAAERDP